MIAVEKTTSVFEAIEHIKKLGGDFNTNFFPNVSLINNWITRKQLFISDHDDTVFFFKKENDFWRLYFVSKCIDALKEKIQKIDLIKNHRIVVDLVERENKPSRIREALLNSGFVDYQKFIRMAKTNDSPVNTDYKCNEVSFAEEQDADDIHIILLKEFDRVSEHIPDFREIKTACRNKNILVLKNHHIIIGILYFDKIGTTTNLRYWYVDEKHRGLKVGAKLMSSYKAECRNMKRFILWVNSTNQPAINKYLYYGYNKDSIVDQILVN